MYEIKFNINYQAAIFLIACQSPQKNPRGPAETTVLGSPHALQDSQTESTNTIVLQDLKFAPQIKLINKSLLKINEAEKHDAECNLKLTGPRTETLGRVDEDAPYRLDLLVRPNLAHTNGTPFQGGGGVLGLPIVLPLDVESRYKTSATFQDYADVVAGENGWYYKDGHFTTFSTQHPENYTTSNGVNFLVPNGKVLITKVSVEVDPYFRHVSSITHEVRLGNAHQKDTDFSKLPLQSKMVCTNAIISSVESASYLDIGYQNQH